MHTHAHWVCEKVAGPKPDQPDHLLRLFFKSWISKRISLCCTGISTKLLALIQWVFIAIGYFLLKVHFKLSQSAKSQTVFKLLQVALLWGNRLFGNKLSCSSSPLWVIAFQWVHNQIYLMAIYYLPQATVSIEVITPLTTHPFCYKRPTQFSWPQIGELMCMTVKTYCWRKWYVKKNKKQWCTTWHIT